MELSDLILVVHVLGAIVYSAATLMSLFGLFALRRVQRVEQARVLFGFIEAPGVFSSISLLLTVASGVYMVITSWGWQTGWIDVTLGSLVVLLMPVGAVMGTRRRSFAKIAGELPDGPIPDGLRQQIYDPLLGTTTILLNAMLAGIIFLMVVKPALVGSLVTMGVSIVLGLVLSVPARRAELRASKSVHA